MRNGFWFTLASLSLAAPLSLIAAVPAAHAAGPLAVAGVDRGNPHDLKHPLGAELRARRRAALLERLTLGPSVRATGTDDGRYVELEQTRNDHVFVLLVEFGDQIPANLPDTAAGPRHNEIGEPDRETDNTTIWRPDFDTAHYGEIIRQLDEYYFWQSSGRYGLDGQATDWVGVPFNEARYGSDSNRNTWELIVDGVERWVEDQRAKGWSEEQLHEYLSSFDIWDRYDHDNDGNFDESDGYIDHFLLVHAGEGEETGGGAQGEGAIWSHRWFVYFDQRGSVGPPGNPYGGVPIGETGMWVGDYTVQPENGGLGVFAHEYGHDLGLPDAYDTADGENSTGFWTIMSQGSYLSEGELDLGSRPNDLNAWEKLQLGWLNAQTVSSGGVSTLTLGPAEYNSELAQAAVVSLPDRERSTELADPPEGERAWWSGMDDELDNSMVRSIDVPAEDPTLELSLWYDIEQDWDYAYVAISVDGGASFEHLEASITTNENPSEQNEGNGITGSSGGWLPVTFDLADYAGQSVLLEFRYVTDAAVKGRGLLVDSIRVGSFFDGAEAGSEGWTLLGFSPSTGTLVTRSFNAYIVENRQYVSYDEGLASAYNFGSLTELPNWVERFPYQNGVLISYWDDFHEDNNTSQHPGEGLVLPIDAHPQPLIRPDGQPWRPRVQSYDSTFGLEATDAITLHLEGVEARHPSLPGVPVFDDRIGYYRPIPEAPESSWAGVLVPATGTQIRVLEVAPDAETVRIRVEPSLQ